MKSKYHNKLVELLFKLKENAGHFIIQNGSFTSKSGNKFIVKLIKSTQHSQLKFEEISYHPESESLEKQFIQMGFKLSPEGIYGKSNFFYSNEHVENIANEIILIFENIYRVDPSNKYYFDDKIRIIDKEIPTSQTHPVNHNILAPAVNIPTQKNRKISGSGWVFIIIIAIACYITFFDTDSKKSSALKEQVFNSEWDASVQQVEDYVKNSYLNDPGSYKSISWSKVFRLNNTKEVGFPSYQVRHKYRAKNSFGG